METTIVPCRAEISDRFPVASFAVNVPPSRLFEIACATDPRLFHTDWQRYRSPQNFYTSRTDGLLRAPDGHTAWFIPPEQLRRFAGSPRIYYALATYENAYGGAPAFSISPDGLDRIPCIALAADFTGRGLDRARLGVSSPADARYGAVDASTLRWGGDAALAAYRAAETAQQRGGEGYDDGYGDDLWKQERPADAPGAEGAGYDDYAHELGADCRDAEDDDPAASALGEIEAPYEDDPPAYGGYDATSFGGYGGDDGYAHELGADCRDAEDDDPTSGALGEMEAPYEDEDGYGGYAGDDEDGYDDGYEDAADLRAAGAGYDDDPDGEPADDVDGAYGGVYHGNGTARYGSPDGYGNGGYGSNGYGGPLYGAQQRDGGTAVADPETDPDASVESEAMAGRDAEYSEEEPEEEPLPVGRAATALTVVPLDVPEKVRILRVVAVAESGRDGYTAINPDNEYNTPSHPAYHRYHIGLSWGFIQFTQRSGSLGRVLRAIKRREDEPGAAIPADQRFATLFGPSWEELLRVTNADGEEERVQPVGGKPLWDPEWTARFRAAGAVPHVTYAQNEIAITNYVDPNLSFAHWLGLDTPRALAMVWDRCIHMGNGGGTSWIMRAAGPIESDEDRRAALAALGHADLRAFQRAQSPHLSADGRWGPKTHAAMVAALRALGARSPIAIPGRDAILQRMVDAARTARWNRRFTRLHGNTTDFSDATQYALV